MSMTISDKRSCRRLSKDFSGDGKTKQSFRQQCDVNTIVEKARKTGLVTHLNAKKPMYMDVGNVPDYQTALDIVNKADSQFSALSAKVRERFGNDPAKMLVFLSDPANSEEAIKLGLVERKVVPVEKIQKVEVVNPAKPDDTAKPTK